MLIYILMYKLEHKQNKKGAQVANDPPERSANWDTV